MSQDVASGAGVRYSPDVIDSQLLEGRIQAMSIRFGTDGWRAVIAETFTFGNLRLVAQAARGVPREINSFVLTVGATGSTLAGFVDSRRRLEAADGLRRF